MASVDNEQIERANRSRRNPVIFIHGLWLMPCSWHRWQRIFERAGYTTLSPGWLSEHGAIIQSEADDGALAHHEIERISERLEHLTTMLVRRPAIIGHSLGGLLAEILAGRGVAAATVAIDPAPPRGALSGLHFVPRSIRPLRDHLSTRGKTSPLGFEQFRSAFASSLSEKEAHRLYELYALPASGAPIFQATAADLDPWTRVKVNGKHAQRGPLMIISGEQDQTVSPAMAGFSFRRQRDNRSPTEFVQIPGRGHSLVIDKGWREVAETALAFVERHVR